MQGWPYRAHPRVDEIKPKTGTKKMLLREAASQVLMHKVASSERYCRSFSASETMRRRRDIGILMPRHLLPLLTRLCLAAAITAPSARAAQSARPPAANNDVFLGYTHSGNDTFYANTGGLDGWDGAFFFHIKPLVPVKPLVGVESDVSQFGLGASAQTPLTSTVLLGPRVVVDLAGYRVFAHGLVGVEHSMNSGGPLRISSTAFAYALGVALDVPVATLFAWRLQADRINAPSVSPSSGSNFRFSTGLVFRF